MGKQEKGNIFKTIDSRLKDFAGRQLAQLPVFIPIPFACGIYIYFSLSHEPGWSFAIFILLIAIFGIISLHNHRFENSRFYAQWLIVGALALTSFGFLAAKSQTVLVQSPVIEKTLKFAEISGRIQSVENLPGQAARLYLSELNIEDIEDRNTPHIIRVRFWDPAGLEIGQKITFLGHLSPPSPAVSPGGFEFQRYAYFRQIGGFGFSYEKPQIIDQTTPSLIAISRQALQSRVDNVLDESEAGVVSALVTGIRSGIPEQARENLRHAGLAHLLAISGLHVGLVAGFLFFFSRLLMATSTYMALYWPLKKIAAVIALAGAAFYTVFVGAPVPTQRALIMTGIALFAITVDRSPFSMRMVALAAFCVLLFQPSSLLGVSFQLSFAAVISLIAFYEAFRNKINFLKRGPTPWHRFWVYITGIALTSIIATLGTAPLTLYHFQKLAAYSVLGNILALPIMVFWVMPAAVLIFVSWPLGLEKWPILFMGEGISWILDISAYVAGLKGAVIRVVEWPGTILALLLAGGLWLCLIQGRERLGGLLPIIGAFILAINVQTADLKVTENGKLLAVNAPVSGKLFFSNRQSERFAREVWSREAGQNPENAPLLENHPAFLCDDAGCRGVIKNRKIAFIRHPYGHLSACRWADILISQNPVFQKDCAPKLVIDRFDLWRKGAHALYINREEIKIETVIENRPVRPWLIPLPGQKNEKR